jgi:excisionase family DNA binding protein
MSTTRRINREAAIQNMLDNMPIMLKPGEVAEMFRVNPKTVSRWAREGKLGATRTMGGHRRYSLNEVKRFMGTEEAQAEQSA